MSDYIIWTLNEASNLVEDNWGKIETTFRSANKMVERGNNSAFHRRKYFPGYPSHRIMLETDNYARGRENIEEYFVPVALKCLGNFPLKISNPFYRKMSAADQSLLTTIKKSNYPFNQPNLNTDNFWTDHFNNKSSIQKVKMDTRLKRGYLELLFDYIYDTPANKNKKHILIGYSQGGFVARFLQYLDRHVFHHDMIAGVITIGAPNWGSPLANNYNLTNANQVLTDIIKTYFQAALPVGDIIHDYFNSAFPKAKSLRNIIDLANYLDQQLIAYLEPAGPTFIKTPRDISLAVGMRKWLTGLVPNTFVGTAFNDLSMTNYGNPYSVLSLINDSDPYHEATNTGYYGSIINVDNQAADILNSFLPLPLQPISLIASQCLGEISLKYQGLMTESADSKKAFAFDPARYEKYISKIALSRQTLGSQYADRHDFVIPSAYQVLHSKGIKGLLENKISNKTHATGMNCWPELSQVLTKMVNSIN